MPTISSGIKNLSTQMETSQMDWKPALSTVSTTPIVSNARSSASNSPTLSSSRKTYTHLPPEQLPQEDYPGVLMWTEDDYKELRKHGRQDREIDGSALSSYMEDEHGQPIPKGTRNAVREKARKFYSQLLVDNKAPSIWSDASLDVSNEFVHTLESNFGFLRLCEGHWKAIRVATNGYSQWYLPAVNRRAAALAALKEKAKVEVIDIDAEDNDDDDHGDNDSTGKSSE